MRNAWRRICAGGVDAGQHLGVDRSFPYRQGFQKAQGGRDFGIGQLIDQVVKPFLLAHLMFIFA